MPNIGSVLKDEITRLSRKQSRQETESLKKAVAQYRSQIADLKRRMQALEQQVKRIGKGAGRASAAASTKDEEEGGKQVRFSAKSLASQRRRLGLSAAAMAKLLNVSALSVYKWESGNTRPRAKQIHAIAELRGIGRREAQKRLEALG